MKIRSNKKRSIKASNDSRKWVNTEVSKAEWNKLRKYLKEKGYKYEPSEAGSMVHVEVQLNDAEIKEVNKFIDTLDDVDASCGKKSVKAGTTSRDNVKPLSVGQARVFTYQGDPCVFVGVPNGMIFQWYSDNYEAKSELNYVKNVIKQLPNDWEESLREYGFDQFDDTVEYQKWSAKNPVKSSCGKKSVKASAEQNNDIVFYFDGKLIYEGDIDGDFADAVLNLCQNPEANGVLMEYCNSFGDPFDFDGTPEDTTYVFTTMVGQDYDETTFLGEDSFYVEDTINGHSFEIFPKSEEVTSSISRRTSNMKITANKRRKSVKASKYRKRTPIMAGAGAGYTIEWELERIGAVNSFTVTDVSKVDKYGNVTIKADCDVDLVVTIKSALSYMYGMTTPIENVPAKMYRVELDLNIYDDYTIVDNAGNEKLLLNPDDYESGVDDPAFIAEVDNALYQINEMQASTLLEYDTNWQDGGGYSYGGGYSHSTWDGTILSDDEYHYAFIQVTDEAVIEYIDKAVQGENNYSTYEVFVDDNSTGYSYDTEEEAIAEAKSYIDSGNYTGDIANTYVERQDWFEFYDGDTDLESSEIVWNAFDEYENDRDIRESVRTKKSKINASKRRAIKADVDYFQLAVDVFNNSLARLNEYFKGEVTFKAVVGDVFGAKHTGLYEDDGEAFMLDLQNLVNANGYSVLVNDYLTEYLQHPLYLAVINGTQEQYISEYISGEDMDNIDPTVAYGMEDEWWNTFNYDCYNLAWEIADTIAKYLTNFSMIVEDTDVAFYEDNAGEIKLTEEDYGDWIIE